MAFANEQSVGGDGTDWLGSAACVKSDPEIFFSSSPSDIERAKTICRGCRVMQKCLDYALDNGEVYGVWGGCDQHQLSAEQGRRQRVQLTRVS